MFDTEEARVAAETHTHSRSNGCEEGVHGCGPRAAVGARPGRKRLGVPEDEDPE